MKVPIFDPVGAEKQVCVFVWETLLMPFAVLHC